MKAWYECASYIFDLVPKKSNLIQHEQDCLLYICLEFEDIDLIFILEVLALGGFFLMCKHMKKEIH